LAKVIDLASGVKPASKATVNRFLLGALGLFSVGAGASWTRVYCFGITNHRLACQLRKKLHRALLNAKKAFFDEKATGDLTALQEDIKQASQGVTVGLSSGLRSLSTTASHSAMCFHLSPQLMLVSLSVIPVLAVRTHLAWGGSEGAAQTRTNHDESKRARPSQSTGDGRSE